MAVKEILISEHKSRVNNVIKEVRLLSKLDHPHVVKYLGTDFQKNVLFVFMEYVPGGSVESMLSKFGSFPEDLTKVYARQILTGLAYLHASNILHRDIKGANVLVSNDGVVKLSDFGASKEIEELTQGENMSGTVTGTPLWMAPEVVLEKGYGMKSDIYSFGATVFEMLSGQPPNAHLKNFAALVRHWDKATPVEIPTNMSPEARDFLALCLAINPDDRPSVEQLLDHDFVRDVDAETVPLPDGTGSSPPPATPPDFRSRTASDLTNNSSPSSNSNSSHSSGDPDDSTTLPSEAEGGSSADAGDAGSAGSAAASPSSSPPPPSARSIGDWGRQRLDVLVADANAENLAATTAAFEAFGATVVPALTPAAASDAVASAASQFDLFCIDDGFPAMGDHAFVHSISGLGLALTLRCNPQLSSAFLIFTSSNIDSFSLPKSLIPVLQMDALVSKPIDSSTLFDTIAALFQQ